MNIDELTSEEIMDTSKSIQMDSSEITEHTRHIEDATAQVEASKAQKQADDAAAAAAAVKQAQIDAAGSISFEDLARGGDTLMGNYYWFEGEIIQDAGGGTYRVSITKNPGYSRVFWEDPILVAIEGDTPQAILENDVISYLGQSLGTQSYESIFGQDITLPLVSVEGAHVTVTGRTS